MSQCGRCGAPLPHQFEDCVSTLVQAREDYRRAAESYIVNLHHALSMLVANEWASGVCGSCGGSRPDHEDGCQLKGFIDATAARQVAKHYTAAVIS